MKRTKGKINPKKQNHAAPPAYQAPGREAEPNALLEMQQQLGNQVVTRFLGNPIQRSAVPVEDEEVDFSAAAGRGTLRGRPGSLLGAVEPVLAAGNLPDVQRTGPYGVTATINLTFNTPTIDRSKTAAQISADHDRENIAGFTEPSWSVPPPRGTSTNITIDITIDTNIEVASDYTGVRGQIVLDHEQGHVNIIRRSANRHLRNGLIASLEAVRALNATNVPPTLNRAISNFETEQFNHGQEYDTADYARMDQAYIGARTPLADLEEDSGSVRRVVGRLRNFIHTAPEATQGQVEVLSQEAIDACGELPEDDLHRLQYNPEFKALVELAKAKIDDFIAGHNVDLWLIEFSYLHASTRTQLNALHAILDRFTWRAPQ